MPDRPLEPVGNPRTDVGAVKVEGPACALDGASVNVPLNCAVICSLRARLIVGSWKA